MRNGTKHASPGGSKRTSYAFDLKTNELIDRIAEKKRWNKTQVIRESVAAFAKSLESAAASAGRKSGRP